MSNITVNIKKLAKRRDIIIAFAAVTFFLLLY